MNDRALKHVDSKKLFVFSGSVLCLGGRIADYPRSETSGKDRVEWFTQSPEYREVVSIDGEPVVFEWKIFPGHTTLQLLQEIQITMEEIFLHKKFEDRIIFMSMYNGH